MSNYTTIDSSSSHAASTAAGAGAFDLGLRQLLEDPAITKVVHDSLSLSLYIYIYMRIRQKPIRPNEPLSSWVLRCGVSCDAISSMRSSTTSARTPTRSGTSSGSRSSILKPIKSNNSNSNSNNDDNDNSNDNINIDNNSNHTNSNSLHLLKPLNFLPRFFIHLFSTLRGPVVLHHWCPWIRAYTANLPTNIVGFRGFDSSIILI